MSEEVRTTKCPDEPELDEPEPVPQSPAQRLDVPVFESPAALSDYVPESPGSSDNPESPPEQMRRSGRLRSQPLWMSDYVDGEALLSHIKSDEVPREMSVALADPSWKKAMTAEYDSLMKNEVWDLVPLPKGKTAIGGKWHLCLKYGSSGEILRHKARYVAKGYSQVYGRDYDETYSPTVKLSTVRCVLAMAAQWGCSVEQMDIKTAFLNAPIDEEVYLNHPLGFEKSDSGRTLYFVL